jgi:hypothetical protein
LAKTFEQVSSFSGRAKSPSTHPSASLTSESGGKQLPLNNVAPISTLLNKIANDFPTESTQ